MPEARTFYSASEARNKLADIFDDAYYGETVIIEKRNKTVAVVPVSVLERLAEVEARLDEIKADAALSEFNEVGGKTLQQLKEELDTD